MGINMRKSIILFTLIVSIFFLKKYAIIFVPQSVSIRSASNLSKDWFLTNILAQDAYQGFTVPTSEDIIVAVIDTGVDYTHTDLASAIWKNHAEYNGILGVDDDQNGYTDDIYGIDTYYSDSDPMDTSIGSYEGHGTHVAGTILTTSHVTPTGNPYHIKIMAIKAGDDYGNFNASDVAEALDYAVSNGASVINLSIGTNRCPAILQNALENASKSAILVAAAGNKGYPTEESDFTNRMDTFPAVYPYIIGVMAHDQNNVLADFSNWDYKKNTDTEYEISAPGVSIYSAFPKNTYQYMSGTSMATAVTSGAAALLCAKYKGSSQYSPAALTGYLMHAGDDTVTSTDLYGTSHSFHKLNLYDLLKNDPHPELIVKNLSISDSAGPGSKNNQDGKINPGETIQLSLLLRNRQADAKNITMSWEALYNTDATYINSLKALTETVSTFSITIPDTWNDSDFPVSFKVQYNNACDEQDHTVYNLTYPISLDIKDREAIVPQIIPMQGITLSSANSALSVGKSQALSINYIPENTTDPKLITWSSSNPSVISVDASGTIHALQKGSATITANVNQLHVASKIFYVILLPAEQPTESPTDPKQKEIPAVPLKAPILASIQKKGPSSVLIAWNKITAAKGYTLYRKTGTKGIWKKLITFSSSSVCSYKDKTIKTNKLYYYKIQAIGTGNDKNSTFSKHQKICIPQKIKKFTINKTKNKLQFTWNKNSTAKGYEIYCYTKKNKKYTKFQVTKYNNLTIAYKKHDAHYLFKVRAYTIINNKKIYGPFSSILQAPGSKPGRL